MSLNLIQLYHPYSVNLEMLAVSPESIVSSISPLSPRWMPAIWDLRKPPCSSKQSPYNLLDKCFFSIDWADAFLSSWTPFSAGFIHGEKLSICSMWQLDFFLKSNSVCSLTPSIAMTFQMSSHANRVDPTLCPSGFAWSGKTWYQPNLDAKICPVLVPTRRS